MNTIIKHQAYNDITGVTRRPLPKAWVKAAGMLRGRAKAVQKHVAAMCDDGAALQNEMELWDRASASDFNVFAVKHKA